MSRGIAWRREGLVTLPTTIDPDLARVLAHFDAQPVPAAVSRDPAARRDIMRARARWLAGPVEHLARVADAAVSETGVPVRLYDPSGADGMPLVIFIHGGAWSTGDLDTHDALCRSLARRSGCLVLAVDYRRSPEHPYPAALDDLEAVIRWLDGAGATDDRLLAGWDRRRLAFAGDSAGGGLAAALSARHRSDPRLRSQLLIYPMLDATMASPSLADPRLGVTFPTSEVAWSYDLYCPDVQARRACDVSPLFCDPGGLPRTAMVLAEFDVLIDEDREYARRLRAAGVPVRVMRGSRLAHGYIRMTPRVPAADRILSACAAFLRASARQVAAE